MKTSHNRIQSLVIKYEKKLASASIPFWMDVEDILDVLDYYEERNRYFEAEVCMRIAKKLYPDNPEVQVRHAYRLKNEGNWEEAVAIVNAIPEQENVEISFFKAEVALSEVRPDDAEDLFNKCLKDEAAVDEFQIDAMETPRSASPLLLDIGELCMDYGFIVLAKKYLSLIPRSDGEEYSRAALAIAECSYQSGYADEALKHLDNLLDDNAYNLDAWLLKADLCNELKHWEACCEAADYALAIHPDNEKALRLKACAAIGTSDYNTVLEVFRKYRKLYPNDYTMALSAGEILLNRKRYDEAFEVLSHSNRNCPNENPDKIRILTDIALCFSARHEKRKAFETLMTTRSLGVSYSDVAFHAATQAFDFHDNVYAEKILLDLFSRENPGPELRLNVSRMLCERNLFGCVPAIWKILLSQKQSHPVPAAPYLAFAARRLVLIREYKFWLACAIYTDPTLTNVIFREIYPNCLPQEYLTCAQKEFPES